MGFNAFLEIRDNNSLSIQNDNLVNVGNPLATFLESYEDYLIRKSDSANFTWFSNLESSMKVNLQILIRIMYFGEGGYSIDEINYFRSNLNNLNDDIQDYLDTLINIERKWYSINDIMNAVIEMYRLLSEHAETTYWFNPDHTLPAFKFLLKTLIQAKQLGGKEVRIQFL